MGNNGLQCAKVYGSYATTNLGHIVDRVTRLAAVFLLGLIASFVVSGCGGSGSGSSAHGVSALAPAGTKTFTQSVTITGAAASITDGAGVSLAVPPGAMASSSIVKLIKWSGQRSTAAFPTCTFTQQAIDVVAAPSQFVGAGRMTLNLPWSTTGDSTGTTFAAFGPAGVPLVLVQTPGSTQAMPQATIGAHEVAYLGGVPITSTQPVEFQIAIEQIPLQSAAPASSAAMAKLNLIWSAPQKAIKPFTAYAGKKRIGITIHGVMNTTADVHLLSEFMASKLPTDGKTSEDSYPFDEVYSFEYNWKDLIETNGALFAQAINARWGDPSKYEVHIFGHSQGGIVARWAVEQVGTPSVTQMVTIGSPSKGVPLDVMRQWWLWFLWPGAANNIATLNGLANALAPGPNELVEGSALLKKLSTSSVPNGVEFEAIGGTKADLKIGGTSAVADAITLILTLEGRLPSDGFVPLDSALGNAATSKLSVPFNHGALCDNVASYWPGSSAGVWVEGINRSIAALTLPYAGLFLGVSTGQKINVLAKDKDGSSLDADILFDTAPNTPGSDDGLQTISVQHNAPNPALVWTVDDPTVLSFSAQNELSVTVTGLKIGTATITVTDPASGAHESLLVTVSNGTLLITPPNKSVEVGSQTTYSVALVTGAFASGTTYNWSVTGTGSLTGGATTYLTTTSNSVVFTAPATAEQDTISVTVKDPKGNLKGSQSTPIHVGYLLSVTPLNPTEGFGGTDTFTVARTDGKALPSGVTYKWSISGSGKVAGSATSTTTAPTVAYTAPQTAEIETLTVQMLDSQSKVLGSTTNTVTVTKYALHLTGVKGPYVDSQDVSRGVTDQRGASLPPGTTYKWTCGTGLMHPSGVTPTAHTLTTTVNAANYFTIAPLDGSTTTDHLTVQAFDSHGNSLGSVTDNFSLGGQSSFVVLGANAVYLGSQWNIYAPTQVGISGTANLNEDAFVVNPYGVGQTEQVLYFQVYYVAGNVPKVGQTFPLSLSTTPVAGNFFANLNPGGFGGISPEPGSTGTLSYVSAMPREVKVHIQQPTQGAIDCEFVVR